MASLTLKKIPKEVMERLRGLAERERRSLNQQAILLLERGLVEEGRDFSEAYGSFLERHGPSPLDEASFDAVFEGLRRQDMGRSSPLETDSATGGGVDRE